MRCCTSHLQIIASADSLISVDNKRVSVPKGISVLDVKPGWEVSFPAGVTAYDLPANAFFFSRSNNDREFQLLKEKLDLITSNISENQSVISSQLSALAADVAEIKATGAKSSEVSAIISRLDELSGNVVTVSQLNELSGQIDETYLKISDYNPATEIFHRSVLSMLNIRECLRLGIYSEIFNQIGLKGLILKVSFSVLRGVMLQHLNPESKDSN